MQRIIERFNKDYFKTVHEISPLIKISWAKYFKKTNVNSNRILIVSSCLIGDFVVSLHAIHSFILDNKNNKIDLVVTSPLYELAKHINGVDKVYVAKSSYQRKTEKYAKILPKKEYKFVLVMRMSPDAYKTLSKVKFGEMKTYAREMVKYSLHILKSLGGENIKQWREVNFDFIGKKIRYYSYQDIFDIKKKDYLCLSRLNLKSKKKIVVHTGSGWPSKLWDNDKWIELVKRINDYGNFQFIFVGGEQTEEETYNKIRKAVKIDSVSAIKKINVFQNILLMSKCDLFIGVDSGPRHLANLVDIPGVCLLGPGLKTFMPTGKKTNVIKKSCKKCTSTLCVKKNKCMDKIGVKEVFSAFKRRIT
ncbi:MAG: glycosyltransferase family 9 protein [Nanoarchaeota archaeon]|nr:glycosyltransferase family 9 protein [Nanoarchaeota archaeon]